MLGEQLKRLRHQKGLTQQQMGDYLHVTNGTIAMWELNKRLPDVQRLLELSKFFGVTVDYLLDEESITGVQEQTIKNTIQTLEELTQQLKNIFPQEQ